MLKKLFNNISLLTGAVLRYFGAHFGVCTFIFESCSPSYFMEFCTDVFLCYYDNQCAEKNFNTYPSLWGIMQPMLGIFLNVLRNLKHSLDLLHECHDITVMVTKLRTM